MRVLYLLFVFIIFSCKEKSSFVDYKIVRSNSISLITKRKNKLTESEKAEWLEKDVIEDTISGISLKKAYSELLNDKVQDTVIVAILDSPIDINHEDFAGQIWVNKNEIPGNNLDDDDNGYIDDVNGWNFLGNKKFNLYESTRILKKYDPFFGDLITDKTSEKLLKDTIGLGLYKKAKEKYDEQLKLAIKDTSYANMIISASEQARHIVSEKFPKISLNVSTLDSLKILYTKDTILLNEITKLGNFLRYGFTPSYLKDYKLKANETLYKLLNRNYDDRLNLGDDPENLSDNNYGNGFVDTNINFFTHGTIVAGVIAASRNNDIGINGIVNTVKIMPVCISGYGDELDKDIALGIRYAVDNGARVINMSFGKEISMNKKWVDEALQYAKEKDVLIVSSAGNKFRELTGTNEYPTDSNGNGSEIDTNFLHIGASSHTVGEKLTASFSNYSITEVDIFAPGININTLLPNNKYKIDSGTSMSSAVVSGVAALILSTYPKLSASEVKEIILESGTSYNVNVRLQQNDGTKKMVPFSSLSKSGKVLNAYNALLLAAQVAKGK